MSVLVNSKRSLTLGWKGSWRDSESVASEKYKVIDVSICLSAYFRLAFEFIHLIIED